MIWAIGAVILFVALGPKLEKKVSSTIDAKTRKNEFVAAFLAAAKHVDWGGIPPTFGLAVADLETGGGGPNSVFGKGTNNLFSITAGSTWKGEVYAAGTGYKFRKYKSLEDSMFDFVRLMHKPLYSKALAAALAGDIKGFGKELKAAGYDDSEPRYADILVERYGALKDSIV